MDEVRRMVERVAGERELPPSLRPMAEARVLEELLARRLVLAYAKRTQTMVATEQVDRLGAASGAAGGAAREAESMTGGCGARLRGSSSGASTSTGTRRSSAWKSISKPIAGSWTGRSFRFPTFFSGSKTPASRKRSSR